MVESTAEQPPPTTQTPESQKYVESVEATHEGLSKHWSNLNNENKIDFAKTLLKENFKNNIDGHWPNAIRIAPGEALPEMDEDRLGQPEIIITPLTTESERAEDREVRIILRMNNSLEPEKNSLLVFTYGVDRETLTPQMEGITEGLLENERYRGGLIQLSTEQEMNNLNEEIYRYHEGERGRRGLPESLSGQAFNKEEVEEKNLKLRQLLIIGALTMDQYKSRYERLNGKALIESLRESDRKREFYDERIEVRREFYEAQKNHQEILKNTFIERYENLITERDEQIKETLEDTENVLSNMEEKEAEETGVEPEIIASYYVELGKLLTLHKLERDPEKEKELQGLIMKHIMNFPQGVGNET